MEGTLTIEDQKLFTDILDKFSYETIAKLFIELLNANPQFRDSDPQSQIFIDSLNDFLKVAANGNMYHEFKTEQ